jgi:hypothetical protein
MSKKFYQLTKVSTYEVLAESEEEATALVRKAYEEAEELCWWTDTIKEISADADICPINAQWDEPTQTWREY